MEIIDLNNTLYSTHIYYFGESSNTTYTENDSIKNSISEMIGFFYPKLYVTNINKQASHAGTYWFWLSKIDPKKNRAGAFVLTLNLRSFNAGWIYSKLEGSLNVAKVLTGPYPNVVNHFLLGLSDYNNKTEEEVNLIIKKKLEQTPIKLPMDFCYKTPHEWDYYMANGYYVKKDGAWDDDKIRLACHYIKAYAFTIDEQNPRVKDLDSIAGWCNRNKIPLYLNLMSENVQYADSLVGIELVFLMKKNRQFLMERYNKNYCTVVDNLETVKGNEFIDQNWTTEHYTCHGRMRVAKKVAVALKKEFKNNYKEVY